MTDQNVQLHHYNSLEFFVTCPSDLGEQVRICGNSIETGNWNPFHGHRLITDKSTYPEWKSLIPLILRNNAKLQFKACKISGRRVIWQKNNANRQIANQNSSIIKFTFDEPDFRTLSKKITEIDCREGTFQIIHEMESSETSSIQFRANYPLEYYFETEDQKKKQTQRKYSDSQLSSNLFSQNDLNIDSPSNQRLSYVSPTKVHKTSTPQLFKGHAIKPRQLTRNYGNFSNLYNLTEPFSRNNRSRSKSDKQSDSRSKSKRQQVQSPYMVRVPNAHRISLFGQNTKTAKVAKSQNKNVPISSEQINDQNKSTTTVIQQGTDDDYFINRDQDVVIQTPSIQFLEV